MEEIKSQSDEINKFYDIHNIVNSSHILLCPICESKINDLISVNHKRTWCFIEFICSNDHIWWFSITAHYESIKILGYFDNRTDYKEYIKSDEWKAKADAAKERSGYRCQLCNSNGNLHAHHRTYERLGDELPEDITVLCADCHAKFHDKGGK